MAIRWQNPATRLASRFMYQVPKAPYQSAFFVPPVYGGLHGSTSVRRILIRGNANLVQPATLCLASKVVDYLSTVSGGHYAYY